MQENLLSVIKYCVAHITELHKRPLFVGVTGDSGSGKSYLTNLIKQEIQKLNLTCTVVNHDEFLISRSDREPMKTVFYQSGEFTGKSHWEILENMFRLEEFERVITELKDGKCAEYYAYSRESGEVNKSLSKVCPSEINIFDSSMLLEHMDFVILVDVTQENIIIRKVERDSDIRIPEEITDMHERVQGYYWQRRKPQASDIIIDNNDFANIHVVKSQS